MQVGMSVGSWGSTQGESPVSAILYFKPRENTEKALKSVFMDPTVMNGEVFLQVILEKSWIILLDSLLHVEHS